MMLTVFCACDSVLARALRAGCVPFRHLVRDRPVGRHNHSARILPYFKHEVSWAPALMLTLSDQHSSFGMYSSTVYYDIMYLGYGVTRTNLSDL